MESSIIRKLRSGKFALENIKHISVKDASKRSADPLPDVMGKKRILGDITNKTVSNKKSGIGNIKKGKNSSHSYIASEVEKIKIVEETTVSKESSSSELCESTETTMYVTALEDSVIDISPSKEKIGDRDSSIEDSAIEDSTIEDSTIEDSTIEDSTIEDSTIENDTLPSDVQDFDKACLDDPFSVPQYVGDVFKYYREREKKFVIAKYLDKQREMTKSMRAILVDWMVEVQESFELNHETLYLAVKLVDYFLMRHLVAKTKLQLIGATALFVASKYDERIPPLVDDFLYICGDSYDRQEMIETEIKILKTVDFDLGIPLSYRFLRRYARCDRIPMDLLTLARYILETSLMDYDVIDILDSKMAAAALLLALRMKKQHWTPTLQYYSGYSEEELKDTLVILNRNISNPPRKLLQTIRTKYSHQIFFGVAKIPPLSAEDLQ